MASSSMVSSPATAAIYSAAAYEDIKVERYIGWTWAILVGAVLAWRLVVVLLRYIRHIACLGHDKQRLFLETNPYYAFVKRNILLAPIFRKRHHRELRLSAAINIGTLPSRLQFVFLVGYIGMNVALCVVHLPYDAQRDVFAKTLRNRTGVLSVINMIPLFLFAGRNNPLIWILGISFDTYNLLHRWIGRLVVIEGIAHSLVWTINKVQDENWKAVAKEMTQDATIGIGSVAFFALVLIILQTPSIVRHAFYETFLHVHFILGVTATVAIWMHIQGQSQQSLLGGAIVLWAFERFYRLVTIIRNNLGRDSTHAEVEALPGDAVKVTLHIARPWTFKPGQHIFLYIPNIGWWTSHPFSVAWSEEQQDMYNEKGLPLDAFDVLAPRKTTMSLIVRRRTGFTEQLWKKTQTSPSGIYITKALVEGPYGNSHSFSSYGTVMLFAAGVGITHQVPYARSLVASHAASTTATRRVILVWIIQSPEHLEWIRPWMTQILSMEKRRDVLKILLFVTRPRSVKEIHSPSASVQMYPGKPDVGALLEAEQRAQVGAMAVSVCGTGSLGDDVRAAVRERCGRTEIDFVENAFSW